MARDDGTAERWALFRHAVIGRLLISPPPRGQLQTALRELAAEWFVHPVTGEPMRIGFSTLERWYALARKSDDPVGALQRKVRHDAGQQRSVSEPLQVLLRARHAQHPTWSYDLHYRNVEVLVEEHPELGPLPSYATVRRAMKRMGLYRQRRQTDHKVASSPREVRSFEKEHAHALWHLDFHHGKRNVMQPDGRLQVPKLLAVLDDHSRLCCHAQWYLEETTAQLIHALIQALLKRGLPRAILMDGGAAMVAEETRQGLARLGITLCFTQPQSPHQNGKQETFFAPVEGQLIAMLEGVASIDLDLLNRATLAWVERDYHRRVHREIGTTPLSRLQQAQSVGRPAPSVQTLRDAFRIERTRKQRRGDGTITIEGVRFQIPSPYRHIERVTVRYARFDLTRTSMVDPRSGVELCRLRPLDKHHNADGHRATIAPRTDEPPPASGIAPLLERLMADYERAGHPPAYLPERFGSDDDDPPA